MGIPEETSQTEGNVLVNEAKQQMVIEGRIKMNEVLGTGKLDIFKGLKKHFQAEDGSSHISMFADKKGDP